MTTPVSGEQFASELCEFIADEVAALDDPILHDTDLLLTGMVDSLGVLMISSWVQQRLAITIDPVDVVLENFQTVGQLVDYVSRRGALSE